MSHWINLSIDLTQSTAPFPGDKPLKLDIIKTWDKDGYNLSQVSLTMHLGTHIDYKKHVLNLEDDIKFDQFIGHANVVFIDVKNGLIRTDDIRMAYQYLEHKENMLIISTNHEQYLGTEKYWKYPKFEESISEFLKTNNISLLGADLPSYEYVDGDMLKMHQDLLSHDIYLVENLRNLNKLSSHIEFMVLPLFTKEVEASVVRAIAKNL